MLGFFYFVFILSPVTRDVTCSVTLFEWKKYEDAMSDERPLHNGEKKNSCEKYLICDVTSERRI